ncbi:MAG: cobyrinate a,c-diamide synthase [Deltaproteobacteria bacterium]|nr:cobyrinate a,c-diamide synthase [Deltaproteobacteria bacterium]
MTDPKKHPAFIIAGTNSSCGKTTVTLGIMEALKRRAVPVSPFKAGPDFIDPGHHRTLLARPSYNLDAWMMGARAVQKTFYANSAGSIGVIEGVMGLFDGKDGGNEGSTAQLAKILNIPVLLVVNAEKTAGSAWAIVKGFTEFDPAVNVKWVVFNKVAGPRHFLMITAARPASIKTVCLGYVPRDQGLSLPERHLGLVTAGDLRHDAWKRFVKKAGDAVEGGLDLNVLLNGLPKYHHQRKPQPRPRRVKPCVKIAVAADNAFSFYYAENLDILEGMGVEIKPFSPLKDKKLPEGVSGIYIGGGYPELFAKGLEANSGMRREILRFARSGMPVYAECGGLMYLGRSIKDIGGKTRMMCGVFQWKARLLEKRKALGYREITIKKGCPTMPEGATLRGHEFHYSELASVPSKIKKTFSFENSGEKTNEGYAFKNTLATYVHAHFASCPGFAEGFVGLCRSFLKNTV